MTFVSTVVALFVVTIAAPVLGQVFDISSDLNEAGRSFSCTGEVVTYTCSSSGSTLRVNFQPLGQHEFTGGDRILDTRLFTSSILTLTSRIVPNYTANLQITVPSDAQQMRINVSCSTDSPGPLNNFVIPLIHESQIEPPSNVISTSIVKCTELISSRSVLISWIPPVNPKFDIAYYLVRIYVNGIFHSTRTSRSNNLDVDAPFGEFFANVSSVSTCGTISAAEPSTDEPVLIVCSAFYAGILVPTLIGLLLIITVVILVIFLVRAKRPISSNLQKVQDDEKGEALEHRQSSH